MSKSARFIVILLHPEVLSLLCYGMDSSLVHLPLVIVGLQRFVSCPHCESSSGFSLAVLGSYDVYALIVDEVLPHFSIEFRLSELGKPFLVFFSCQ